MAHCQERIGEAYFRTPRNTVTAFVNMLAVLEQNPGLVWTDLIAQLELREDTGEDMTDVDESTGSTPPRTTLPASGSRRGAA
ncbi:ATP-binding protein [Paracoccus yeei]|uniref:ATP-binding protein n=1 Tax=Paracoccus yeei TaxID=147645 RepID=UPI0021DF9EEA|nr:ATP-binding protein [Paracoccus yeei]